MNDQPLLVHNEIDAQGNPTGGFAEATGLAIRWQNGPLSRDADRQEPNGAFVETVLRAARERIKHYNECGFECVENHVALSHIDSALRTLAERTARRELSGVEGTHEGN